MTTTAGTTLAANMEWLYTEAGDETSDRVRAAAEDGFTEVEIWGWKTKNLEALKEALNQTGVQLKSLIVDPQLQIANPDTHAEYLAAVTESVEAAKYLGSPNLVVVAQQSLPDIPREQQMQAVKDVFAQAVNLVPDDITLLIEPLNDQVDHPGTLLTSTKEALDMIDEIGSPRLRLLFDAYHSLMMEEEIATILDGRMDLVGHVQIADIPGRHEPGSGEVDWAFEIEQLKNLGYTGSFGLEYMPTGETSQTVAHIRAIAETV